MPRYLLVLVILVIGYVLGARYPAIAGKIGVA